jgi:outer membrane protein TolC
MLSAGAAENEAGPTTAGVAAAERTSLTQQPSIWEVLREQYREPAGVEGLPAAPSLGVEPARMTLREAVSTAIAHNPGLEGQRLTPLVREQGILAAQAQFDPLFGADLNLDRRRIPAGSVLQGAATVSTADHNGNLFISKGLLSGGTLRLDWTNNRLLSDSTFQALSPQYKPETVLSLNQPLLRDFGLYFTRLRIQIAESTTEAAIADYRAQVAQFIEQVVVSYWNVILTREQLQVRRDSLELARQTVRDNRTRVDVGVLPPVAIKESEAEAARREEDVIVAANAFDQAVRTLQQVVYLPGADDYFARPIDPVEQPLSGRVDVNQERSLRIAILKRAEIESARQNVRAQDLTVALNKNQLLPRLDLYGYYGMNGLSGTSRPFVSTDPVTGQQTVIESTFPGGYVDSLDRMVGGSFYSYQGGIKLQVPIGNAQADSQYTQSRIQRTQAGSAFRQKVSDVTLEVGKAVGDAQSNMERIEATRVARELTDENLRNQMKRYDVGMATTTDLLKFQNDVANARLAEIQAVIDYNDSLTELDRAQGTLLERFNVSVEPRRPTHTPWWAGF